jgi:copper homeostasis protein (lipoprotein)
MKTSFFACILFATLLADGCATHKAPSVPINPVAQQATFEGTLPCADCSGIHNTLLLYRDQYGHPTRYQLTEKYLGGKGNLIVIERGDWEIKADSDHQAKGLDEIFVLSPQAPNSRRLFLHDNDNSVELLDQDGSLIDSGLDYTLKRTSH